MSLEKLICIFCVIILIVIFILVLGIKEKNKEKEIFLKKVDARFGKLLKNQLSDVRLKNISGYFKRHKDSYAIDDISWSDLSMNKIFFAMNNTYSSAGEEYLYYLLRNPSFDKNKLEQLDADVDYFLNNYEKSREILNIIRQSGKLEKYSVYDYLTIDDKIKDSCKDWPHILSLVLLLISIVTVFLKTGLGIILSLFIIVFNIAYYFKKKNKIFGYLISFKYIMRLYNSGKHILSQRNLFSVYCGSKLMILENSINALKPFSNYSKFVFTSMADNGNLFELLISYFNMIFHLDLIMFNHMVKNLKNNEEHVDSIVEALGYIDAAIAISSFRKHFENACCKPEFCDDFNSCKDNIISDDFSDISEICAVNAYHPLLKNPVKNDYKLNKSMLITGSNASGKSTFLKTVAINQLFAQTIYTVLADSYKSAFYRIFSSMALNDDIIMGDSYFMVEIKALKRILINNSKDDYPILCFVDEVLRGTNTVERIAASTQVLKYFADNNILCLAATHDIELTSLLENDYDNYHFKEEVDNGDIHFSYKLLSGKAESRNAIKLLKLIGYQESIVEEAEKLALHFMDTGNWN